MSRQWKETAGMHFRPEKPSATGSIGMVVTNHPLGSAAGVEMLAAGGNAIDAAVASLFALTVVEPMMVGIFGAGMSTIRLASGEHRFINNYSIAPAAASENLYEPVSSTWPDYQTVTGRKNEIGVLATGVPGSLRGWTEMLADYGTLSLADVMQPAIRYAKRGYRVSGYLAGFIVKFADDIARFPETARIWMPGGSPLKTGDRVVQPQYAETLELIADRGPDALYTGELGTIAVEYIQGAGGILTLEDLRDYQTMKADVVKGSYRGFDIVGPPPPSAGGVHVIEMLNILEGFDVRELGFGTVDGIHLLAEVIKTGFEDRNRYLGDPAFVEVPVDTLISKRFARERRERIDMGRARMVDTAWRADSSSTTHMAAADADGNVIAATHTIHSAFGAKATIPGTGILLNNTMNIFDPHPGTANSIEPGKRVASSMSPIIVEQNDAPAFCLGLVGGMRIFPSALQAIVNMIDHRMSPQEAVEAPRIWTLGEELEIEPGLPDSVKKGLSRRGHHLSELPVIGGGMGLIEFGEAAMTGACCWRADGTPIGMGGGPARQQDRAT